LAVIQTWLAILWNIAVVSRRKDDSTSAPPGN
jgi:hypothetical protein